MDPVNINAPPAFRQSSALHTAKLSVVLQRSQCTGSLYVLDYSPSDSSETILRKLRICFYQQVSTPWTRFWSYSLPCRKVAVGTATLDAPGLGHRVTLPTRHTSGSSDRYMRLTPAQTGQVYPIVVNVLNSKPNRLLTEAFHNPKVLQHSQQTVLPQDTESTVILWPVLDKVRLCYLLAAVLVASQASAAVVAWYTAKVELGVAVCVGVFTMVSTVQAMVAWVQE